MVIFCISLLLLISVPFKRALSFVQGELTTCLLDSRGDLTSYLIERPRFVFLFSLTSCVTLNKSHPSDRFQFSHAKMMTRDQVSS